MGLRTRFGIWTFLELVKICTILFLFALFASFIIGSLFTKIDKTLEDRVEKTTNDCLSNNGYITGVFLITFFQLVVIAGAYYIITKFLRKFFPDSKTIEFSLHIVLIVLLIELNPSIVHNLHQLASIVDISKYHHKC